MNARLSTYTFFRVVMFGSIGLAVLGFAAAILLSGIEFGFRFALANLN